VTSAVLAQGYEEVVFVVFYIFIPLLETQQELILLPINDYHAEHMEFFFRHSAGASVAMIVVDAHTDTMGNEYYTLI